MRLHGQSSGEDRGRHLGGDGIHDTKGHETNIAKLLTILLLCPLTLVNVQHAISGRIHLGKWKWWRFTTMPQQQCYPYIASTASSRIWECVLSSRTLGNTAVHNATKCIMMLSKQSGDERHAYFLSPITSLPAYKYWRFVKLDRPPGREPEKEFFAKSLRVISWNDVSAKIRESGLCSGMGWISMTRRKHRIVFNEANAECIVRW